jgi:hypothetical protein
VWLERKYYWRVRVEALELMGKPLGYSEEHNAVAWIKPPLTLSIIRDV